MMGNMPAIPASTRSSITLRLLRHAKEHWPKLENLQVTCRGGFAYATAALPGEDEPEPLFRLRYGGSAHSFGFALWSWAAGRYEDSVLLTGSPVGTPQEALDTACTLYYADVADETDTRPQTNLRGQPLRSALSGRSRQHSRNDSKHS
jgi:hypothetical protein